MKMAKTMKIHLSYKLAFSSVVIVSVCMFASLYLEIENGGIQVKKTASANLSVVSGGDDMIGNRRHQHPDEAEHSSPPLLRRFFYDESCPSAERIIRRSLRVLYRGKPSIAPALIRLLFHDCFIQGCDASVLLDSTDSFKSEKDAAPNLRSLKGMEIIDQIKSDLEHVCPRVVSCADIIALSAREAVKLSGGPRYPLKTGRRDSFVAFMDKALTELPSPHASLSQVLESFRSKGFSERETVCLSGAHSIGVTHCKFFEDRLYNFSGTGKPDPELHPLFLQELRTRCPFSSSATIDMSFGMEGNDIGFGVRYYKKLIEKKAIMHSDQQLMASPVTEKWVRNYASDGQLFRHDFAAVMMKLSSLNVLTGSKGAVRSNCSVAV
ncbi:unnamed protein product [Brassica oleracea]